MKKLLTAFAIVMLFASCQKEGSFEDPTRTPGSGTNGGSTNGNRLFRIGSRVGTDSITTDYSYNSANRLVKFSQTGIVNGIFITADVYYVRNAANIITSNVIKSNALSQFGLDSVEAFHDYDPANTRYKHSITRITTLGETETDSVVFVYNAGKLTAAIDYYDDGTGSSYVPYSKEEYAYSGGNLAEIKLSYFNDATNAYELEQTVTYAYDDKTNPVQASADAVVMSMALYYSANNYVKSTTVQAGGGSPDVVNVAYTYTSNNQPKTAISSSSGTVTSSNTYYYQ